MYRGLVTALLLSVVWSLLVSVAQVWIEFDSGLFYLLCVAGGMVLGWNGDAIYGWLRGRAER